MNDPTYAKSEINADPVWQLAFSLSEIQNDNAPIGWSKYIYVAECLLNNYDIKRKEKGIAVCVEVDMIKKSMVTHECDICILISGDTDFVPAVNLIKKAKKEVLSAFVPFGYSSELRKSTPYFIIRKETLIKCFRDYKKENK